MRMLFHLLSKIAFGLTARILRWAAALPSLGRSAAVFSILFGLSASGRAATVPLYSNLGNVLYEGIDATTIVNYGTINASTSFQPLNMLNFTNLIGGSLLGSSGVQLEFATNAAPFRSPASYVVNLGTISGDSLRFSATNLINSGELRGGEIVDLSGNNVTLTRSVLSASVGAFASFVGQGFRLVSTNGTVTYQNPSEVADLYWGAGTGRVMRAASSGGLNLPSLNSAIGGFRPPQAQSPSHEAEELSLFGGTLFSSRSFKTLSGTNYIPFVRVTRTTATNVYVQVVLVQTNSASTNVAVDVRFETVGSTLGDTPVVAISAFGSDIATGVPYTNSLYFLDYINTLTNSALSANLQASSSRPAAYEISRDSFYDFLFSGGFGITTNDDIANVAFYQNGFAAANITNNLYAAYQAAVGKSASSPSLPTYNSHLDDPTNFPGRVVITANNLDMSLARIRADNLVSIQATNLISSTGTLIDAPNIQLSIANTNSTLILTNFTTSQVARPNGTVSFYSTVWTNSLTNASPAVSYRYHVLMVDASQLSGVTPVTLQEFSARGTNVIINNTLSIGRSILVDSPALTFSASSSLNLPSFGNTNLFSANFPNLNYFTNLGEINVPFQCVLGSDRPAAIASFINRGALTANSIDIRAVDYVNAGTNLTRSLINGVSVGGGGPISILADSAKFDGGSSGGLLSAGGSIFLAGNDIKIRNHRLTTAGTLVLSPTNSLTDTGISGTNRITCALGFSLTVKPAGGDLLGTTIYTTAPFNRDVPHVWAGTNIGPVPAGYTNNAALGRLLIDTGTTNSFNRLSFSGVGTNDALYVDYLELTGTITNDLAAHLFIETNMTIYFASANVPVQNLDGQLGGRLRWVKDYAGLNTGVDFRLSDGRTVKVNVAKLNSPYLDSDGDGIVNVSDLSPFDGVVINSGVSFTNVPPLTAFVTWEAAAQTVYQVEASTNLLAGGWQFLANFTNSASTNRVVTFSDVVPAGSLERYFRVSYQP